MFFGPLGPMPKTKSCLPTSKTDHFPEPAHAAFPQAEMGSSLKMKVFRRLLSSARPPPSGAAHTSSGPLDKVAGTHVLTPPETHVLTPPETHVLTPTPPKVINRLPNKSLLKMCFFLKKAHIVYKQFVPPYYTPVNLQLMNQRSQQKLAMKALERIERAKSQADDIDAWNYEEFAGKLIRAHGLVRAKGPKNPSPSIYNFDPCAHYTDSFKGMITKAEMCNQLNLHAQEMLCIDDTGITRGWTLEEYINTFVKLYEDVAPHITASLEAKYNSSKVVDKFGLEWVVNEGKSFGADLDKRLGVNAQWHLRVDVEKNIYAKEVCVLFGEKLELVSVNKNRRLKFPNSYTFVVQEGFTILS